MRTVCRTGYHDDFGNRGTPTGRTGLTAWMTIGSGSSRRTFIRKSLQEQAAKSREANRLPLREELFTESVLETLDAHDEVDQWELLSIRRQERQAPRRPPRSAAGRCRETGQPSISLSPCITAPAGPRDRQTGNSSAVRTGGGISQASAVRISQAYRRGNRRIRRRAGNLFRTRSARRLSASFF